MKKYKTFKDVMTEVKKWLPTRLTPAKSKVIKKFIYDHRNDSIEELLKL